MKKKNKHPKLVAMSLVGIVFAVAGLVVLTNSLQVQGISEICEKSAECRAAAEKEEQATAKSEEALNSAEVYRQKVDELTGAIATEQATIERTEDDIVELQEQIEINQEKLLARQKGLAKMLVKRHFDDSSEPIMIIAGSNSISDLAEKATREEVARKEIASAAAAIKETKETLVQNKEQMDAKLAEQKQAKQNLVSMRTEKQNFVAKYENDADAYAAEAEQAREEQKAAIAAYQKQHQEVFTGSYYGAYNSYPYQDSCPYYQDGFIDDRGYYGCECTSYAAWKAYEYLVVEQGAYESSYFNNSLFRVWGNASSWYYSALARGFVVDSTPSANSIGQQFDGPYGHVFWVESTDDTGVNITEYNNYYSTGIYNGGSYHSGDFGARHITYAEAANYNYIHLD